MRFVYTLLAGLLALPVVASGNELIRVYELAKRNDATFQAAKFTRDAALEARPQALAGLLPQIECSQVWQHKAQEIGRPFRNRPTVGERPLG